MMSWYSRTGWAWECVSFHNAGCHGCPAAATATRAVLGEL